MKPTIISYCNNTWPSTGGVARYDTQLSMIFPDRFFFKGPEGKESFLHFVHTCENPIVITDNHLACDVPTDIPTILVHHGCAMTTAERNPDWDPYWKDLCCTGQGRMLTYRHPGNTIIISISKACTDDFTRFFPNDYPKFRRHDLLHPSEFDETKYKTTFNTTPRVLGNWNHMKKGGDLLPAIKHMLPGFEFNQLDVQPVSGETLQDFNIRKQQIYIDSDIFLQLSNSEGFSYASQDGAICGLVNVCTNVGAYHGDVPSSCYQPLEWSRCFVEKDSQYVAEQIQHAWDNRYELGRNIRDWYMKNCRFTQWSRSMLDIVDNFNAEMYE